MVRPLKMTALLLSLYIPSHPCVSRIFTTPSLELVYCPSHQLMIVLIKGSEDNACNATVFLVTDEPT